MTTVAVWAACAAAAVLVLWLAGGFRPAQPAAARESFEPALWQRIKSAFDPAAARLARDRVIIGDPYYSGMGRFTKRRMRALGGGA